MSKPVLGYWDIRGLTEPIRYLLHSKGVDFEDKRYLTNESWQNEKYKLGLDFPNLPYYIDGDVKLTQSTAILRYVARKYDLAGHTEKEKIRIELAEQQLVDFRINFFRMCWNPEFETVKAELIRSLPAQLQLFSVFLGDRKFFIGDHITYVDFLAYDSFSFYQYLAPTMLNDFKNLKNFQDRIENLPSLQSYFKSPTFKRWPVTKSMAYFGGKGPEPNRM